MTEETQTKTRMRDRIKGAVDGTAELVPVPEWDIPDEGFECIIEVRSMTGDERADSLARYMSRDGDIDYKALYPEMMLAVCFDPDDGSKVFDEEDLSWLGKKNAGVLERVAQVGFRLSGLDKKAKEKAQANLSDSPSEDSISALPSA